MGARPLTRTGTTRILGPIAYLFVDETSAMYEPTFDHFFLDGKEDGNPPFRPNVEQRGERDGVRDLAPTAATATQLLPNAPAKSVANCWMLRALDPVMSFTAEVTLACQPAEYATR
jgi:hypothetical protein